MDKQILIAGLIIIVIGLSLFLLPNIQLAQQITTTSSTPTTVTILSESFPVSDVKITHTAILTAGDNLTISIKVNSGGDRKIDFSLLSGGTVYTGASQETAITRNFTVPKSGYYQFVYDNTLGANKTTKVVSTQVMKHYLLNNTITAVMAVPVIPVQFGFSGLVLIVMGIVVAYIGNRMVPKKTDLPKNADAKQPDPKNQKDNEGKIPSEIKGEGVG